MTKTENYYLSSDGIHKIHTIMWKPEGEIKGILQISHGMCEFVDRYDGFARFLSERGYLVIGNDHLGHGKSVNSPDEWGYIAKQDGLNHILNDIHSLRKATQENYPGIPYFMLGHSFGSYLLRSYLTIHSDGLSGAIIMGTGTEPKIATSFGKIMAVILSKLKSDKHRSNYIVALSQQGPYKNYDLTGKTANNSWLTRDEDIVRWYYNEPACAFIFTVNGYMTLFNSVETACAPKKIEKVNKGLPLFFVSGDKDPVGNMGKGVNAAVGAYKKAGIKDVSEKLYNDMRHEILNEIGKEEVMEDIYNWMEAKNN